MRYFILGIGFLIVSCSGDFFNGQDTLNGTWLETGNRISAGGPLSEDFMEVTNGNTFVFRDDGTFLLSSGTGNIVNEGIFSINNGELALFSSVDRFSEPERFRFQLISNVLILSPMGSVICTEGCFSRYQRINN